MKTAGIILILFSGTGLGLCKSMELTARLKILEKLAQLFIILNFNYFHFTSPSLSISEYDHFNKVQKNNGIIRMLSYKNPALVLSDNNSIPYI